VAEDKVQTIPDRLGISDSAIACSNVARFI
jgi:hypothetical protein